MLASRNAADVLAEAEALVAGGVKELLVISQDTSAYGVDLKYAESEWRGEPGEGAADGALRSAVEARRVGAAALCLPLSACG